VHCIQSQPLTIEHGAFLCSNLLEIEGSFFEKYFCFAKLNRHFEEEGLVM
jgi:hypothetical protein